MFMKLCPPFISFMHYLTLRFNWIDSRLSIKWIISRFEWKWPESCEWFILSPCTFYMLPSLNFSSFAFASVHYYYPLSLLLCVSLILYLSRGSAQFPCTHWQVATGKKVASERESENIWWWFPGINLNQKWQKQLDAGCKRMDVQMAERVAK